MHYATYSSDTKHLSIILVSPVVDYSSYCILGNMEDIGHKLMAFRIDEQLLGILYSQINQALEKLGATNTLNMEGKAAVELAFYLLSFGINIQDINGVLTGTPGMQAVGLSVQSEATGTTMPTRTVNLLRSVLVLSFLTVKWSTSKLQDLSTLGGWFAYPQVPRILRTYPNKCNSDLYSTLLNKHLLGHT